MNAVFLFDTSGVMAKPWAEAGVICHLFDLQNTDSVDGNIHRYYWECGSEIPLFENTVFVAAWPPCTDVACSGARWFKGKGLRALGESILQFAEAAEYCEASGAPYIIENPKTTISTYWRAPDYKFHPCHYNGRAPSASYTKETWLWAGGGFVMPPFDMDPQLEIDTTYIHHQPPSKDRANIRSETPPGFPEATFEANYRG